MSAKISIVIPCYDNWDGLHQLLSDIHHNCAGVFEVIVVDDESPDPSVVKGLSFWKKMKVIPLKVLTNTDNLGFDETCNRGLKYATGDIKVLISTDVRILSSDLLHVLDLYFEENPRRLVGGTVYTNDTGWNKFGEIIVPYAEGYFLAARDFAWEELGYLDEQYSPGDFEDVDLSLKAMSTGYELKQLYKGSVQHKGGGSFGYTEERKARTNRNRAKFAEKWSLND